MKHKYRAVKKYKSHQTYECYIVQYKPWWWFEWIDLDPTRFFSLEEIFSVKLLKNEFENVEDARKFALGFATYGRDYFVIYKDREKYYDIGKLP